MHFEWDEHKAAANLRKHGVSFDEAKTIFDDENLQLIADPRHFDHKERLIAIGYSQQLRVLLVCHCYRSADVISIITARKANAFETKLYR